MACLVVLVDSRGRLVTDRVSVDDDDTFEGDDISLVTQSGQDLNEGSVTGLILGLGRDGVAGDGILPGQERADLAALESYIRGIGTTRALTREQVVARILDETTDEVASDDLLIQESFRYADGSTSIETVRPEGSNASGVQQIAVGDTMEVVGLTNRKPDDNTITVGVVDGPSANEFDTGSTDQWGGDGIWSVTLGTDNVEPGTYTIEVDDGDNTDTVQVQIVAAEAGGNETENASGNATATPAGNATGTENGSASLNGAGPAPATTGPVALVLLLVAALGTMTSRREE